MRLVNAAKVAIFSHALWVSFSPTRSKRIKPYFVPHANNFTDLFSQIEDPRVEGRCDHLLVDILFITLYTVLSNRGNFKDMVEFGK